MLLLDDRDDLEVLRDLPLAVVRRGEPLAALQPEVGGDAHPLWRHLSSEGQIVGSVAEGLDRVRRGEVQLLLDSETAHFYTRSLPCDLEVIHEFGLALRVGFAMPRGHPQRTALNAALQQLKADTELWSTLKAAWFPEDCGDGRATSPPPTDSTITGEEDTRLLGNGWVIRSAQNGRMQLPTHALSSAAVDPRARC